VKALIVLGLLMSVSCFANETDKNVRLTSATKVKIDLSYKLKELTTGDTALFTTAKIIVNVSNTSALNGEVVFINTCLTGRALKHVRVYKCQLNRETAVINNNCTIVNSNSANEYFSYYGSGIYLGYKSKYSTGDSCKQEVAVNIAGEWLKDPINGTSNFQMKL
jgi:hypothetical protein